MGYSALVGSFNINTAKTVGQTQAITGVGFTPKVVLFWWSGTTESADGARGESIAPGFGAMASSSQRWCCTTRSEDAAATSDSMKVNNDDAAIKAYSNTTTLDGAADFSSFDGDGFTLIIDDQFTIALRVSYLALGGDDLTNVKVGTVTRGNVGNWSVADMGFQPDALILSTAYGNAFNETVGLNAALTVGIATGAANQGVVAFGDKDNQATTSACAYGYSGECNASVWGGYAVERDALVSMDAGGFTCNNLETNVLSVGYVGLKGGQYKVGQLTTRTDGNDIVEAEPNFQPVALLFLSANRAENAQDTPSNNGALSIGAATSTSNRAAQAIWDEHNLADSETATANYDTACYANVADDAIVGLMDIKSIEATGFVAVMDDTDPAGCWVTYLAIGAAAGGAAQTLTPDALAIPTVIPQPTVTLALGLTPDALAIPTVIPAPTLSLTYTLAPTPVAAPLVIPAPTLALTLGLTPSPVAIPMVIPDPTLALLLGLSPDPVTIPLVLPAPTVGLGGISVSPDPVTIPMVIPDPTLALTLGLTPSPVVVPLVIPDPTLGLVLGLTPSPVVVTLVVVAVSIGGIVVLVPVARVCVSDAALVPIALSDAWVTTILPGDARVTLVGLVEE
jgi:hypothetical protein